MHLKGSLPKTGSLILVVLNPDAFVLFALSHTPGGPVNQVIVIRNRRPLEKSLLWAVFSALRNHDSDRVLPVPLRASGRNFGLW